MLSINVWCGQTPFLRCRCTGGVDCSGVYGAPAIAEQAPPSYPAVVPKSAAYPVVGTRVTSQPPKPPIRVVATNPITAKPVYETPVSAIPTGDRVSTISRQSGANPAPIPAVGTVSPQACCGAPASGPVSSMWGGLALFAGIIIALWIFAGMSLRKLGV